MPSGQRTTGCGGDHSQGRGQVGEEYDLGLELPKRIIGQAADLLPPFVRQSRPGQARFVQKED